ncbi:TPA: hypothetical protein ACH3X1_007928 [Trebouxia sp. C0004]
MPAHAAAAPQHMLVPSHTCKRLAEYPMSKQWGKAKGKAKGEKRHAQDYQNWFSIAEPKRQIAQRKSSNCTGITLTFDHWHLLSQSLHAIA